MGVHGKEKPFGEGEEKQGGNLALCSSVGGRVLANTGHGSGWVASSSYCTTMVRLEKLELVV